MFPQTGLYCSNGLDVWLVTLPYVGEHFTPDRGAYACWNRLYIIEQSMASSQSTPIHKRKNKKKGLHCSEWQLMVHVAVAMGEPQGANRDTASMHMWGLILVDIQTSFL